MSKDFKSLDKLSPLVQTQVPEFVRIDHPTFVAFLNAYYEWLETQGAYLRNPMDLAKVKDIDTTFDEYIKYFKQQYLLDFPESFAVNQNTGDPVEPKTIVKYIKQFYRAKGTEKTFEFLFRVLYDTNVEFYYPKVDILKASDGKWIRRKTIRVAGSQGQRLFESSGRKIYQGDASGVIKGSASVVAVSKYQFGSFFIYELEISNINGTFNTTFPLQIEVNGETIRETKIYSVVTSITITNGGSNYRVGDRVVFTNASGDIGQNVKAKVTEVSSSGKILVITIEEFGINYLTAPTITVSSEKGTGFAGTCSVGAVCNFAGYYANNDGRLNTNKVIQDSHYYQNYSYVLKTEIIIDRYREALKRLIHPAGFAFFGQISLKRCVQSNLDAESALVKYEVPLIGHYVPYTNKTSDDLKEWFTVGATSYGYSPLVHDTILNQEPNPIQAQINFLIPNSPLVDVGFPKADPWWIIYQHPNRRITNTVVARIEHNLYGLYGLTQGSARGKTDFLFDDNVPLGVNVSQLSGSSQQNPNLFANAWNEWTLTGNQKREQWADGFTNGFKYATLKYNNSTEFRKITVGSFFNMPLGEQFDCNLEWNQQINNGNPNSISQYTTYYLNTSTTGGQTGATAS